MSGLRTIRLPEQDAALRAAFPSQLTPLFKGFRHHDFRKASSTLILRRSAIPEMVSIAPDSNFNDFTGSTQPTTASSLFKATEALPAAMRMLAIDFADEGTSQQLTLRLSCRAEGSIEELLILVHDRAEPAPAHHKAAFLAHVLDCVGAPASVQVEAGGTDFRIRVQGSVTLELYHADLNGMNPRRFGLKMPCAEILARCAGSSKLGRAAKASITVRATAAHFHEVAKALSALEGFDSWEIATMASVIPQQAQVAPLGEWMHRDGRFLQCDEGPDGITIVTNFDCESQLKKIRKVG